MYYKKEKTRILKDIIADYPAPEVSEESYSQHLNTSTGRTRGEVNPIADFGKYFGEDIPQVLSTVTNERNETNIEDIIKGVEELGL